MPTVRSAGDSDHVVETGERSGLGVLPALGQAGLAGVAGAVMVWFALFVVALAAVAKVAPEESRLSLNLGERVIRALVIVGVSLGLLLLGWSVGHEVGIVGVLYEPLWVPSGGLVFALVAGMFLRRWYLALGSFMVLVVLGLYLLSTGFSAMSGS